MDYKYVFDLSDKAVADLTSCLARQPSDGIAVPSEAWLRQQERNFTGMGKELLRPKNPIKRLAIQLAENTPLAPAILCDTHNSLNPILVRHVFVLLATEVTLRGDRVRGHHGGGAHLRHGDPNSLVGDLLRNSVDEKKEITVDNVEVAAFVDRMNATNGLWMYEMLWAKIFNAGKGSPVFERVVSCCEACILSVVGGNAQHLVDLKANMISRTRKGHNYPRLMRYVDGWMAAFGPDMAAAMKESSEELSDMIKYVRKEAGKIHHERRKRKEDKYRNSGIDGDKKKSKSSDRESVKTKEGIPLPRNATKLPGNAVAYGEEESSGISDILNYYLNDNICRSGVGLPTGIIHPAFTTVGAAPAPLNITKSSRSSANSNLGRAREEAMTRERSSAPTLGSYVYPSGPNPYDLSSNLSKCTLFPGPHSDVNKRPAAHRPMSIAQAQESVVNFPRYVRSHYDFEDESAYQELFGKNKVPRSEIDPVNDLPELTRQYLAKFRPQMGIDRQSRQNLASDAAPDISAYPPVPTARTVNEGSVPTFDSGSECSDDKVDKDDGMSGTPERDSRRVTQWPGGEVKGTGKMTWEGLTRTSREERFFKTEGTFLTR